MATPDSATRKRPITASIRQRIERGGERLWRLDDFRDFPFTAVAQALSRLTRDGAIERLSKGVYYRNRQTVLGKSRPNPAAMQKLASPKKTVFPSGIAAANLLGFTTQTAKRAELATSGLSLPRKLVGSDALIHTRRPEAWASLTDIDAALLDFLRQAGRSSELSPEETVSKLEGTARRAWSIRTLAESRCYRASKSPCDLGGGRRADREGFPKLYASCELH